MLARFVRDEKGQDMVEYGLLGSFISVCAIVVLRGFAPLIQNMYQLVESALS
jgi:Flp pilus assembly pilin Flp